MAIVRLAADRMTPHYADESVTLYAGDCLDVLATLPDDSVDAVVTDPPYGLGFMGKEWDSPGGTGDFPMRRFDAINTVNTGASRQGGRQRSCDDFTRRQARDARSYQEWCEAWARECLRVLKPGGHMLAFGGTRTAHRLACAIEDAGFELRDTIAWLYGSGFPKSLDVSKAIDKRLGADREVTREAARPLVPGDTISFDQRASTERERRDNPATAAAAAAAAGWGTALKPANEPIIVARKSPVGSVADNWLAHGTGALNIDGCRNGEGTGEVTTRHYVDMRGGNYGQDREAYADRERVEREVTDKGRWPTNVVLDPNAAAQLDAQTGTLTSGANPTRRGSDKFRDAYGEFKGQESCDPARGADSGGASRFFPVFSPYWRGETCCMCNGTGRDASYVTEPVGNGIERVVGRVENGRACRACNGHGRDPSDMPTFRYEAKAPTDERPKVGTVAHPTVKPLDLMRWLVRLVTPPGGVVLEPFAGSGTTAEACIVEGFRCIAIEREADYLPLILARITKPIETVLDFGEAAS